MASTLPLRSEGRHNLLREESQRIHGLFVAQIAKRKRSDEVIAAGDFQMLFHLFAYAVGRSGNIETFGAARLEVIEIVLSFVIAAARLKITAVAIKVRKRRFSFFPRCSICFANIDVARNTIERVCHMTIQSLPV